MPQRIVGVTVVFENSSNSPQYGFAKFLGDGRWVGNWVGTVQQVQQRSSAAVRQ
jgi:hypothetical protein